MRRPASACDSSFTSSGRARLNYTFRQPVRFHPRSKNKLFSCVSASGGGHAATERSLCRRCKQYFIQNENHDRACRYHTAIYTGGEVSKAVGFCRSSAEPEDQLEAVVGQKGIMRFWDCCGASASDAPGCKFGRHVSFDDDEDVMYLSS